MVRCLPVNLFSKTYFAWIWNSSIRFPLRPFFYYFFIIEKEKCNRKKEDGNVKQYFISKQTTFSKEGSRPSIWPCLVLLFTCSQSVRAKKCHYGYMTTDSWWKLVSDWKFHPTLKTEQDEYENSWKSKCNVIVIAIVSNCICNRKWNAFFAW